MMQIDLHVLHKKSQMFQDCASKLKDTKTRKCPVSDAGGTCTRSTKLWGSLAHVVRHFVTEHRDIAKAVLPFSCAVCEIDCKTAADFDEHKKSAAHVAKEGASSKKRSADEAVMLQIVCFS